MYKRVIAILILMLLIPVYAEGVPVEAKLDYNQGIDFYKLGMYERSIESFRSAIRTYPDYTDAYYNLGTVLEYLKQYAEAISTYKQIYVRNPNDYEIVYKLAALSVKLEDYDKANEYLKLIPQSNQYYQKGQEIANIIKKHTSEPIAQINEPSKVAVFPGIYENLISPTGITSDNAGNLYIATFSDNAITKISPEGKRQIFLKSELINGPISLVTDSIGNIYVSNYNANNVLKITPLGVVTVLISNVDKPYGLHVEGNMLFITCQGSNSVLRLKI